MLNIRTHILVCLLHTCVWLFTAKEMARAKCLGMFEDIQDHLVVSDPTAHGRTEHNDNT